MSSSCWRCELLVTDGRQPCAWCRAELSGRRAALRCGPDQLGGFLRRVFLRKRGGLSLRRRATCST